ncbi:MAG: RNA methyltransferase [Planctomycetes bacterium]|nr:RNA methyltransferase [Planctomycetota bacterium]
MSGDLSYYAPCTLGLEAVLRGELEALGARDCRELRGGVRFTGDAELGPRACLWLRSAIRVQLELASRRVRDERELHGFVYEQAWERFLDVGGTLAVDASLKSSFLTHSRFAAQLVKDGIVDRFRDRTGRRPDVDTQNPDLPVFLRLHRDEATLYVDLAGRSLHKRGYRQAQHKSPLNEAIAAGLLLATGWDRRSALCDPMCGSGTFLIEAAWLAGDVAPGLGRSFAFERWQDLDRAAWARAFDDAEARAARGLGELPGLCGADRQPGAVALAERAVAQAGLRGRIRIERADVASWRPPVPPALCVVNPPYGARIGERGGDLETSWRDLGTFLHRQVGAVAWVLSGDPELTRHLRLRASRRLPVYNGPIDCRFVRYEIGPASVSEE